MKILSFLFVSIFSFNVVLANPNSSSAQTAEKFSTFSSKVNGLGQAAMGKYLAVIGDLTEALLPYFHQSQQALNREVATQKLGKEVSEAEALNKAAQSTVVMLSDWHGTVEIKDKAKKIISHLLQSNNRPKVVVFELIDANYQADIEAYFSDRITAEELRTRVKWDSNIGYGWEVYQDYFEFLKAKKIPVRVVLRPDENLNLYDLERRDQYTFDVVKEELTKQPIAQIFVWQGVNHLIGKGHLGDKLFREYGNKAVLYYTHIPHLFWQALAKDHKLSSSSYFKVKGAQHKNTFYTFAIPVSAQESGIFERLSKYLTDNEAFKAELLALSNEINDSYAKSLEFYYSGNNQSAEELLLQAQSAVTLWAAKVKMGAEDPKRILPYVQKELDRF